MTSISSIDERYLDLYKILSNVKVLDFSGLFCANLMENLNASNKFHNYFLNFNEMLYEAKKQSCCRGTRHVSILPHFD